jgi:hypothetical protein
MAFNRNYVNTALTISFVSVKPCLHSDMRIWAPLFVARGYQECKSGGHMELWQVNRAPMNRNGAQRSRQLRSRCVGAARTRTQLQINQSINQSTNTAFKVT